VVAEIDELLRRLALGRGASRVASVWRDAPPRDVEVGAGGTAFTLDVDGEPCRFRTPLLGEHQASNAALALLMVREAGGSFWGGAVESAAALAQVRLPGRFQRVGRFIFDVAHNPDGARVFAQTVARVTPEAPVVALLCVLADKDWRGMMQALAPVVSHFFLTEAPTAPASRAWSLGVAAEYARSRGWPATAVRDFDGALSAAATAGGTVLITGSFHTVGDAMSRLQVDPLAG
jgi:dihydrofolate synthase/folylpolyglutamate synthase